MESLSVYLRGSVGDALYDLHMAILSHFDALDTDMHIVMIDNVLATADLRDHGEVMAFIQTIICDQTAAIFLAHRMKIYPKTLQHAQDHLYALVALQTLENDAHLCCLLEDYDNPEDAWGDVVAYLCGTQPEDYLDEIEEVDPLALSVICDVVSGRHAVEDDDYNEDDSENERLLAVPWVRERVLGYRDRSKTDGVVMSSVVQGKLKLGLPVDVVWSAVSDEVLDLPESQWVGEIVATALVSRLSSDEVSGWVASTLEKHANDASTALSAQHIIHKLIGSEV